MLTQTTRNVLALAVLSVLTGCASQTAACPPDQLALEGECRASTPGLTVADLQAVGTHNSYKIAIPPPELAMIALTSPETAESLDYGFEDPLGAQLDAGMRQLEIDVFHDPEGGRYADPLLPRMTAGQEGSVPYDHAGMDAPGFKVLHTQDIDPRTHCKTFITCLKDIDAWSQANPDHVPLLILVNLKTGSLGVPGTVDALDFTPQAFDALDAELRSVLGPERFISPDEVRGQASSLREAVLTRGWPGLESSRGRLIFAVDTGADLVAVYLRGNASLEGHPMFVNSISDAHAHAAYFTMNDPIDQGEEIASRVAAGYLVRTRADAGTKEARSGTTARRDAAFASGAQYISTDYYRPRTEWSDYQVAVPGGAPARCNPVRRDGVCELKAEQ